MTGPSVEVLPDTSIPDDARFPPAGEVGRLSAPEWPLGEALCVVALDHEDRGDVRTAAVRAMADTPAAAPNQLVRVRGGVGRVPVRAEAVAVQRELGSAPVMTTRFDEQPRVPAVEPVLSVRKKGVSSSRNGVQEVRLCPFTTL